MNFVKKNVWAFVAGVALVIILVGIDANYTRVTVVPASEIPVDTGLTQLEIRQSIVNYLTSGQVGVTDSIVYYNFNLDGKVDKIYPDNPLVRYLDGTIMTDSALKVEYPTIYKGIGYTPRIRMGRADEWYNWLLRNPQSIYLIPKSDIDTTKTN